MTEQTQDNPRPLPDAAALEAEAKGLTKGEVVRRSSPERTGKQRRHLRGLGHHLKPTALVGQHGLTASLADSVDDLLEQHEIVKVKVLEGAPVTVGGAALWLHQATGADVVQLLGRTVLAYRPRAEKPTIKLPRADEA